MRERYNDGYSIAGQLGYTSEPDGKHVHGPNNYYAKWETPEFERSLEAAWEAAERVAEHLYCNFQLERTFLDNVPGYRAYFYHLTPADAIAKSYHPHSGPVAICDAIRATRAQLPAIGERGEILEGV